MNFRLWKRNIKFFWQRLTRGWDDSVTWSLDWQMARFILPRLRRFREINIAYPAELTFEEWQSYLDQMIYSFEWFLEDEMERDVSEANYAKVQQGMVLFGKYYDALWW